ncbi:MAG: hypothetical protein JWO19_4046 [Bryobacterales bacterium]|nr:hypothetical protein [Bryobacterales bacterium]
MCGPAGWAGKHADGNKVPSPPHFGNIGLTVRRLAGVLVGWLGETPDVLPGDAGEDYRLRREA